MTTETIDLSETPTRVPSTRNCTREIRGSVLDVGCGTGENALYLAALGHEMLGIDSARATIEKARGKSLQRELQTNIRLVDGLELSCLGRR